MLKQLLFVLTFLFVTHSLQAQVSLTGTTSYTQNFNTLASTGSGTWTNNSTIPGWYAVITNAASATNTPTTYTVDPGSSNAGGLHSYGATSNTERALGSVGSGSVKVLSYGVLITNNTGSTINALSVNYQGEQWRSSTSTQNSLIFSYKVGATTINETGFTNAPLFDFVGAAPVSSNGTVDGNAGATTIDNKFSVTIPVGQSIMLRWTDIDDTGNDAGLAIDNLTVSVVTTPFLTVAPTSVAGVIYPAGGGPSAATSFTVGGGLLDPSTSISVTPAINFAISTDNTTFTTSPITLTPAGDGSLNQTIYSRLVNGLSVGPYSGSATISSTGVTGTKTVAVSGTVYPAGASGPCGISYNISDIRAAADNITFTATGRVISNIGTNMYIQDATGGLLLYTGAGTTVEIPEVNIGDEVQVTGVITTYRTDRELQKFTGCFVKTSSSNAVPISTTVTPTTACDHKGELVTLPSVTISAPAGTNFSGGTSYTLAGTSTVLYIQNGTDLVNGGRPSGAFDLTGVVSLFDNVCQILPRSTADVPGSTASVASCPEVGTGGTVVPTNNTLDIVWWNVEWLGNTGFGPTNEVQQQSNVAAQLQAMNKDIYCLEEVCDLSKLDAIITTLNAGTGKSYTYTCGADPTRTPAIYYSHWFDDPEVAGDATTYAQKVCFVYNTALVTNVSANQILTGTAGSSDWASNRFPLLMNCDVTINGITKNLKLVGLHAKSGSDNSSYNRRIADFNSLKNYLDATYPTDNIMIMGDFNDDADKSIYVDAVTSTSNVTSFSALSTSANYNVISKQLSNCNISSTASYPDIIDHLVVSNEIITNGTYSANSIQYVPNSVNTIRPIAGGTTTSDHFPVTARFLFATPDLTPTINMPQANFSANATNNFVVNIAEVAGKLPTTGNTVVTITVPTGYTISYDNTLTSINVTDGTSNLAVDNTKWSVTNNVAGIQLTLTLAAGQSIGVNGNAVLGFNVARTTATSGSTSNVTVNVSNDATQTYDGNIGNNIYSRIISGL